MRCLHGLTSQVRTPGARNRRAVDALALGYGPDYDLSSDTPWEDSAWQRRTQQPLPLAGRNGKAYWCGLRLASRPGRSAGFPTPLFLSQLPWWWWRWRRLSTGRRRLRSAWPSATAFGA